MLVTLKMNTRGTEKLQCTIRLYILLPLTKTYFFTVYCKTQINQHLFLLSWYLWLKVKYSDVSYKVEKFVVIIVGLTCRPTLNICYGETHLLEYDKKKCSYELGAFVRECCFCISLYDNYLPGTFNNFK